MCSKREVTVVRLRSLHFVNDLVCTPGTQQGVSANAGTDTDCCWVGRQGGAHLEGDVKGAVTLDAVGGALMRGVATAANVGASAGAGEEP